MVKEGFHDIIYLSNLLRVYWPPKAMKTLSQITQAIKGSFHIPLWGKEGGHFSKEGIAK